MASFRPASLDPGDPLEIVRVDLVRPDGERVELDESSRSDDKRFSYEVVGVAADYRDRSNIHVIEARENDDGEVFWRHRPLEDWSEDE